VERFEYLIVRSAGDKVVWRSDGVELVQKPSAHDALNALGRDGWELVAVTESEVTEEGFAGLFGDSNYVQDLFLKRRTLQ
jgi:hypothetical protein